MPYRAGAGGGAFGSSVYPDSRPKVDIAGGIDAAAANASSMIRQAYQRRLAQNDLAVQAEQRKQAADQIAYQHQRDQVADARANEEMTYRRERDAATDSEKALVDRRSAIERGFTPEHTETTVAPTTATVGAVPTPAPKQSAVRTAMGAAAPGPITAQTPLPGAQAGAQRAAPAPAGANPLPASQTVQTIMPETFDAKKGAKFALAEERANDQASRDTARAANQVELKKLGGRISESLARLEASLRTTGNGSAASKAMTANRLEDARKDAAIGIIGHTNGSYDEAVAYLNSPDGADLRARGVKPEHLMYAQAQYVSGATKQAVSLQTGAVGMEPKEAVGAVSTTRRLVAGQSKPKPAPTAAPAAPSAPSAPSNPPVGGKKAPLSDAVRARAATDTAFATFLKGKGYTPADWSKK